MTPVVDCPGRGELFAMLAAMLLLLPMRTRKVEAVVVVCESPMAVPLWSQYAPIDFTFALLLHVQSIHNSNHPSGPTIPPGKLMVSRIVPKVGVELVIDELGVVLAATTVTPGESGEAAPPGNIPCAFCAGFHVAT